MSIKFKKISPTIYESECGWRIQGYDERWIVHWKGMTMRRKFASLIEAKGFINEYVKQKKEEQK